MQAVDLEIGQQLCCVDAASQPIENYSLRLSGHLWEEAAVVVLLAQLWCSLGLGSPSTVLSLPSRRSVSLSVCAASGRAANPVSALAGLRGCAGHGEEGRGSPVKGPLPPRELVCPRE